MEIVYFRLDFYRPIFYKKNQKFSSQQMKECFIKLYVPV